MRRLTLTWLFLSMACAKGVAPPASSAPAPGPAPDPESIFGPLEVGADFEQYHKVSKAPFLSKTHGGRFVEVYVNEIGYAAYTQEQAFPVGAALVKISWESENGARTETPGPIFVMRKEPAGYDSAHHDWYYAIHWANPAPKWNTGGPLYWRGHSPKVSYCRDCHDNYEREVGGVPDPARAW